MAGAGVAPLSTRSRRASQNSVLNYFSVARTHSLFFSPCVSHFPFANKIEEKRVFSPENQIKKLLKMECGNVLVSFPRVGVIFAGAWKVKSALHASAERESSCSRQQLSFIGEEGSWAAGATKIVCCLFFFLLLFSSFQSDAQTSN